MHDAPRPPPTTPNTHTPHRKFACFAIGNAGFHNPALYDALRPAIAPLVVLLGDKEEKTCANAAGALGNLVRNNGQLCGEIIKVHLGEGGKKRGRQEWAAGRKGGA